jgi:glutamate/tyrosine decarboxylase-like PLP-dependent enzyme
MSNSCLTSVRSSESSFTPIVYFWACAVDDLQKRTGLDIPIHVDGASGAFIAPFAYPKYKWAFDVPRVHSINTSGHKFGLVYAGLGWILWKDESMLHKDLIFELRELSSQINGAVYSHARR